jgi:hypothetical protein
MVSDVPENATPAEVALAFCATKQVRVDPLVAYVPATVDHGDVGAVMVLEVDTAFVPPPPVTRLNDFVGVMPGRVREAVLPLVPA